MTCWPFRVLLFILNSIDAFIPTGEDELVTIKQDARGSIEFISNQPSPMTTTPFSRNSRIHQVSQVSPFSLPSRELNNHTQIIYTQPPNPQISQKDRSPQYQSEFVRNPELQAVAENQVLSNKQSPFQIEDLIICQSRADLINAKFWEVISSPLPSEPKGNSQLQLNSTHLNINEIVKKLLHLPKATSVVLRGVGLTAPHSSHSLMKFLRESGALLSLDLSHNPQLGDEAMSVLFDERFYLRRHDTEYSVSVRISFPNFDVVIW